jgi:hypothetical protein
MEMDLLLLISNGLRNEISQNVFTWMSINSTLLSNFIQKKDVIKENNILESDIEIFNECYRMSYQVLIENCHYLNAMKSLNYQEAVDVMNQLFQICKFGQELDLLVFQLGH